AAARRGGGPQPRRAPPNRPPGATPPSPRLPGQPRHDSSAARAGGGRPATSFGRGQAGCPAAPLCPAPQTRPRTTHLAPKAWSERYAATPSGAVSAGSTATATAATTRSVPKDLIVVSASFLTSRLFAPPTVSARWGGRR